MLNRLSLTITVVLAFFLSATFAQEKPSEKTDSETPKTISGGVVNGKATNLVKPSYPKEAKDAGAGGAVVIVVIIDEQGNVISASGVSGHQLLIPAAEQAARASKFRPTILAGQAVRVKGSIVYNFVLPMPFMQIGFELALAQKTPTPESFPLAALSGTLPRYWTEELAYLKQLESFPLEKPADKEKPKEPEKEKTEEPEAKFDASKYESENRGGVLRGETMKEPNSLAVSASRFTLNNKNPAAVEILVNLQDKLDTRLSPNRRVQWYFRVGRILGSLKAEIDGADRRQRNFAELSQLLTDLPSGVSDTAVEKLREVVEIARKDNFDAKTRINLIERLEELRNLRVE